MIKRRKMRLNGEWQLDGRSQVYELRVWVALIRLFLTRFLRKLAGVVLQKFAQLEEPVSKIISALILI
jgi:hypothetical protein